MASLAPQAAAQSAVELSVTAGFDGLYRRGDWIAVRVAISNTGDNLDGVIRVRTGGIGGLAETSYRTPLDLPKGARKQVYLYVSLESFEHTLQVEVLDQHERVVARESAPLRFADSGDMLFAVVTDSIYGAVDLTRKTPGSGQAYQVTWLVEDIPPRAEALDSLDVLMFHDVNTGALRTEQVAALTQWVQAGGHLIVAGGDAWQRTTSGVIDLLPVALRGTVTVEALTGLADYLGVLEDGVDGTVTVADTVVKPGARVLASQDDTPLVIRAPYGAGIVDFLAVEPNAGPLRTWNEQAQLWYALVASTGQQPSWVNGISDWSMAREATLTASTTALPTFFQLCGFLVIYIILVGPVNYLVLKRLNWRELAWFTIPVLILLFSYLAYRVGFNLRGNVPTVNRLTVVQLVDDGEEARVVGLLGVQSPKRSSYDIAVERGLALRPLPDVGTGLGVPVTITESTRQIAEDIPIDAGTIASFTVEGYAVASPLESAVTWHLNGADAPRMTGRVTNTTGAVLEDAVILIKGESRYLGTMEIGETGTFDIELSSNSQEPGPLTFGYTQSSSRSYYGALSSYGRSLGWCLNYRGFALTLTDVMRGEAFSCDLGHVSDRQQEIRRRYRLLAALVQDTELSGGRDAGAYLFAWSSTPMFAIELMGKSQTEEDTTLYIYDLPVRVDNPSGGQVLVSPGMTTWTVADTFDPAAQLELTPVRFQVGANGNGVFEFMPMPAFRLASVDQLIVHFSAQGPLVVELWNWREGVWEPVEFVSGDLSASVYRPERFIGAENAVNVRVRAEENSLFNQVEYVNVSYLGQLR